MKMVLRIFWQIEWNQSMALMQLMAYPRKEDKGSKSTIVTMDTRQEDSGSCSSKLISIIIIILVREHVSPLEGVE